MDWLFVVVLCLIFLAFYMWNSYNQTGQFKSHFVSARDISYVPETDTDLNTALGGIVGQRAKDPQKIRDALPPSRPYVGTAYGINEVMARQKEVAAEVAPSQIPTVDAFQRAMNGFGGLKTPPTLSPGARQNLTRDSLKFKEYDVRQAINNINPRDFTPNYEITYSANHPRPGLDNGYALDRNAQIITPGVELMRPGDPQQFNIDQNAPYAIEAARQRRTATALPWVRSDLGNYYDDFVMPEPWWNTTSDIQQLL